MTRLRVSRSPYNYAGHIHFLQTIQDEGSAPGSGRTAMVALGVPRTPAQRSDGPRGEKWLWKLLRAFMLSLSQTWGPGAGQTWAVGRGDTFSSPHAPRGVSDQDCPRESSSSCAPVSPPSAGPFPKGPHETPALLVSGDRRKGHHQGKPTKVSPHCRSKKMSYWH